MKSFCRSPAGSVVCRATLLAMCVAACSLGILAPGAADAHYTDAYSHESTASADRSAWMSDLPDAVRVSELSIPGTHDTMTFDYTVFGDTVSCQSMSLAEQLKAGIRFLDIRLNYYDENTFTLHHGFVYLNADFSDVLAAVIGFLAAHPSETVFMRIQQEFSEEKPPVFNTLLQKYMDAASCCGGTNGSWRWGPPRPGAGADINPTIGDIRGKFVIVVNGFRQPGYEWGMTYPLNGVPVCSTDVTRACTVPSDCDVCSNDGTRACKAHSDCVNGGICVVVGGTCIGPLRQEDYELATNIELYDKWTKVKSMLATTNVDQRFVMYNTLNVAGFAGGALIFPYWGASGHSNPATGAPRLPTGYIDPPTSSYPDFPRVDCFLGICTIAYEGLDVLMKQRLQDNLSNPLGQRHTGVVTMDFPGQGLIDAIINSNDVLGKWVDFGYVGLEIGTYEQPFNTLAEGVAAVKSGSYLNIKAGSSNETITINKAMTIIAVGGPVRLGH